MKVTKAADVLCSGAPEAEQLEKIAVSGGKVGLQMVLPVKALQEITGACFVDLTVDK